MNNKGFIFLLALAVLLVTGCKETHNKGIDLAYRLAPTAPDSALAILDGIDHAKLGKTEMARYALVYTIAQDKSGLDVDNDSLLRTAYTYYNSRHDDSLYAKCEYYMGKYYMLNDSTESALDCLQKAADVSKQHGDKHTQCMALEKYSRVLTQTNPQKAVEVARHAETTYSSIPEASKSNIVYTKLNVSMCLLFADSVNEAEKKCKEAMSVAYEVKDSGILSDVYQDMASVLAEKKNYKESLWYSYQSCKLDNADQSSKMLNLAWSYLNADSIKQCNALLNTIQTENLSELYTAYYIRHLAAIKEHDYSKAVSLADSAYHYLEQMYGNQLDSKQEYYNSLVKTKYEEGIAKGKTRVLSWLIVIASLLGLAIIVFILHSYRQFKSNAKFKLKTEKEKLIQEERIHNEELHHKEIQLSTMRSYLLKKINIAKRIEEIRGNKKENVVLTEEDWEEIKMFVDNVEGNFISRLKKRFPKLSDEDIKFMILIRLKMSSKAMGLIYNISEKSIRQKLFVYKSKVGLEGKNSPSLRSYIESF